jgi:hypothetical protein
MAKVKVDFKDGFGKIKQFSQLGAKTAADELKKEVVESISRGVSPVKRSGGRYKKYSTSYRQAIDNGYYSEFNKRKRPVNLRLSGDLLKSIYTRLISKTRIEIGFNDELADIHNRQGAGKSKTVRRMLPTEEGETFTDSILLAVGTKLRRIAKRIFR